MWGSPPQVKLVGDKEQVFLDCLALVNSASAPALLRGKGRDGAARPTFSNEKQGIKQCLLFLIPPHCMGLLLYFVGTSRCSALQHSLLSPPRAPFPLPTCWLPNTSTKAGARWWQPPRPSAARRLTGLCIHPFWAGQRT